MSQAMFDKLSGIEDRFMAIDRAMVDASDDYQKVAELAQERAEIEPIVTAYRAYQSVLEQINQTQALTDSDDTDMVELAQSELVDLETRKDTLEEIFISCSMQTIGFIN